MPILPEEPSSSRPSTFSCRCLICFRDFPMMSSLNAHLTAQHPVVTKVIPSQLFLDVSTVPIEKKTYNDLQLKEIFNHVAENTSKIQKDEQSNNYSHLDYTTQLICKIKNYYNQIENVKKELYKYGMVYTSEFPDDPRAKDPGLAKTDETTNNGTAASTSITSVKKEPTPPVKVPVPIDLSVQVPVPMVPSTQVPVELIQPVQVQVPPPVPVSPPVPVPPPVPPPITVTITNNKQAEVNFITDEKNTYYRCVLCEKEVHSKLACKKHCCHNNLYCSKCNTKYRTTREFNKHISNTTIIQVPSTLTEVIPLDVKSVTETWFHNLDMDDCYRESWKLIFKTDTNKCVKKVKHKYFVHYGCNKWRQEDIRTIKWRIIHSLSKALYNYNPRLFYRIIKRIEECYKNEEDLIELDKEFSQYSSGWWILPENKIRKPRMVKKANGKAPVAKPTVTKPTTKPTTTKQKTTKPVKTKPQEPSTSTQTETKTKKPREKSKKEPKPKDPTKEKSNKSPKKEASTSATTETLC